MTTERRSAGASKRFDQALDASIHAENGRRTRSKEKEEAKELHPPPAKKTPLPSAQASPCIDALDLASGRVKGFFRVKSIFLDKNTKVEDRGEGVSELHGCQSPMLSLRTLEDFLDLRPLGSVTYLHDTDGCN